MNLLAVSYLYPPRFGAGAEWMLHSLLRDLEPHGYTCEVAVTHPSFRDERCYCLDDVPVWAGLQPHHASADVVLTHLDAYPIGYSFARAWRKPLVLLVHSDRQYRAGPALYIANAGHVAAAAGARYHPVTVCRPHVRAKDYEVAPRGDAGAITLVNLSREKGADTFWRLAEMFPERRFLAVRGAYHAQIIRSLPNVQVIENQDLEGMREVYRQTRLIVAPSHHESWGRVPLEAAASGIPSIVSPVSGYQESLGAAAVYASPDQPERWAEWIIALDDPAVYQRASEAARRRARVAEIDAVDDAIRLPAALRSLA